MKPQKIKFLNWQRKVAMGRRGLNILLVSTESLRRQYPGYAMVVHAHVYITNDSTPVQYRSADCVEDVNPRWDHPVSFSLHCSSGGNTSSEYLIIELCTKMPHDGSCQVIGRSRIPRWCEGPTGCIDNWWPISTGGHLYFSYNLGAYDSTATRIDSTATRIGSIASSVAMDVLDATLQNIIGVGISDLFGDDDNQ